MTHHKRPEISKRMAHKEGHVKDICKTLDEDNSYPEIVQQISVVRWALDSVIEVIDQDLVEHYVSQTDDNTSGRKTDLELKETVSNIL